MKKILTIAGISLLSGTAFARAPEPTIEINIDVLQQMVPPPAAPQATPVYKPSVEKPLILPKTAKPCHKPTTPKKKKAKKPKAEKTLPRPEFIKPAPAVIVPPVAPETTPVVPIEVAPPAPAPILEEVKPVITEVAPTPAPVVEQPAAKLSLQDRVLYKLQDWAVAADNWRLGLKDRLMRKTPEQQTPVVPAPVETPVETAPPVDAPKPVEMMKIEKPQEAVPAPQKVEEVKPEPFVIPAEEAPVETPPAAPIANDLAPPPPVVVEEAKQESIFQKAVKKVTNWRNELRDRLADKKPEEKATLPETPPVAAEPEKPTLPDSPPAVAADKPVDAMKELPSAPPPISAKIPLPDAPPAVVVPEKTKDTLPDAPPAKVVAAVPQNILPDVPPVPAAVTKNTGALYVIPFAADSDEIKLEEQGYLLALVQRLKQEENLRIAVQGFAPLGSGQEYEARRLSLKRAVGVRQFLMDKGVDATRVNVQALGSATEESLKDRVDILRIN